MSTFPQITSPPQASAEVLVNRMGETLEHQAVYGLKQSTTTALTWGYYGGRWGGFSITAGTLTLTDDSANYVVVAIATGVISVATASTNWDNDTDYVRVYKITTASGVVSAVEDHRAGPGGVHGGAGGGGGGGSGTVTSVDASGGVETASGSAITATGTVRGARKINAQTGTSYAILATDRGKHLTLSNASSIAATIAQAGGTGFEDGYFVWIENVGAGSVTLTPTTSAINGAATMVLNSGMAALLFSDGTNYRAIRVEPSGVQVNAQTSTSYTYLSGDRRKLVTHTNGSAIAGTLAQATGAFGAGWHMWVQNRGVGTLTITPTTSTIDGAATLALTTGQGCLIASDGTNYYTMRGIGGGGGGSGTRTPSIQTVTSSATVTPTFSDDMVTVTAQAAGLTLANPTGTPIDGLGIVIRIKDNGTARGLAFDTQYRAMGVVLPTTTIISKTLYLAMIYNGTDTKWDVVAVAQQA